MTPYVLRYEHISFTNVKRNTREISPLLLFPRICKNPLSRCGEELKRVGQRSCFVQSGIPWTEEKERRGAGLLILRERGCTMNIVVSRSQSPPYCQERTASTLYMELSDART